MTEYKLNGLHCNKCSINLEEKLNQFTTHTKVSVDYENSKLLLDESDVDIDQIKKILEFEKITMSEMDDTNISSEETQTVNDSHGHKHGHHHGIESIMNQKTSKKMMMVFSLNLIFSAGEFIFGFLFNSIAIMTDAVHDLGDALSIGLASYFEKISTKEANDQYSFGHLRFSLLGALITSVILLGGSIVVVFNAVPRFLNPESVNHEGMFWLSIAAIAANGFAAWLMSRGESRNESAINLHMIEDVLGWVGVLIVSIILNYTDWYILDPVLSIAIASFIIYKTWPLFKETVEIFLEATPKHLSRQKIEDTVLSVQGVTNVSHLHVWSIDGNEHAMTVTISTPKEEMSEIEAMKERIRADLSGFSINHTTIEIVYDPKNTLTKD
ncbi:MAG: cation diffusion facilitator family transporter [Alkalibacterium sp.]|uniref:cation diffusion facilitator family transporter n=1 Tax=Alkalibacterium sp. TaxID=1872447 RepID=UPI003970CB1C